MSGLTTVNTKDVNMIRQEIDTVCRVRRLPPLQVVRRILEFIDCEFHGVVRLPLEAGSSTTNEVK